MTEPIQRLLTAATALADHCDARIDAAPGDAKPVFIGLTELRAAIHSAEESECGFAAEIVRIARDLARVRVRIDSPNQLWETDAGRARAAGRAEAGRLLESDDYRAAWRECHRTLCEVLAEVFPAQRRFLLDLVKSGE